MFEKSISRRDALKWIGVSSGAAALNFAGLRQAPAAAALCAQVAGKKVRWIVPFPPGGGYDVYSRLIAPSLEKTLGASILVANMPGGGGILGAYRIAESVPDGLTLGMVDGSGLLVALLVGEAKVPDLLGDFNILARVVKSQQVLLAGTKSGLKHMEDIFDTSRRRPIVFGISEVGNISFVNCAAAADLLGMPCRYVAGYAGSRQLILAAIRGEVDLISLAFHAALDRIEARDLSPILQTSFKAFSSHPSLNGVPVLGGSDGLAARQAANRGLSPKEAQDSAEALIRIFDTGRLIVGPTGLEKSLSECLEARLHDALSAPAFLAAASTANRPLDVARGKEAEGHALAAASQVERLAPIVRRAIREIRG